MIEFESVYTISDSFGALNFLMEEPDNSERFFKKIHLCISSCVEEISDYSNIINALTPYSSETFIKDFNDGYSTIVKTEESCKGSLEALSELNKYNRDDYIFCVARKKYDNGQEDWIDVASKDADEIEQENADKRDELESDISSAISSIQNCLRDIASAFSKISNAIDERCSHSPIWEDQKFGFVHFSDKEVNYLLSEIVEEMYAKIVSTLARYPSIQISSLDYHKTSEISELFRITSGTSTKSLLVGQANVYKNSAFLYWDIFEDSNTNLASKKDRKSDWDESILIQYDGDEDGSPETGLVHIVSSSIEQAILQIIRMAETEFQLIAPGSDSSIKDNDIVHESISSTKYNGLRELDNAVISELSKIQDTLFSTWTLLQPLYYDFKNVQGFLEEIAENTDYDYINDAKDLITGKWSFYLSSDNVALGLQKLKNTNFSLNALHDLTCYYHEGDNYLNPVLLHEIEARLVKSKKYSREKEQELSEGFSQISEIISENYNEIAASWLTEFKAEEMTGQERETHLLMAKDQADYVFEENTERLQQLVPEMLKTIHAMILYYNDLFNFVVKSCHISLRAWSKNSPRE